MESPGKTKATRALRVAPHDRCDHAGETVEVKVKGRVIRLCSECGELLSMTLRRIRERGRR